MQTFAKMIFFILLGSFIGLGRASATLTPIRCEKVFDQDYQNLSNKLLYLEEDMRHVDVKNDPDSFDPLIDKTIRASIKILDNQKVAWRYSDKSKRIIVIEPDPSGTALNQIAARLDKDFRGFTLEIDPRAVKKAEASALYLMEQKRILINTDTIVSNELTPILNHELQHAENDKKFLQGQDEEFNGAIFLNSDSEFASMHSSYSKDFSIDENITYAVELEQTLSLWDKNPSGMNSREHEALRRHVRTIKNLSGWTTRVTARSLKTLTRALEEPDQWIASPEIMVSPIDGKDYPFTVLKNEKNPNEAIWIYEIPTKTWTGKIQMITTVDIIHGKFESLFYSAKRRRQLKDSQWLALTAEHIESLQRKVQPTVEKWSEIEEAVKGNQTAKAFRLVKEIKDALVGNRNNPT